MFVDRVIDILGTKYPIVQAPMSWITNAQLVSSVSNSGGFGVLGPNAGQTEVSSSMDERIARIRQEIKRTKDLTENNFGVNIIQPKSNLNISNNFWFKLIEISLEEGISHFVTIGDVTKKFLN